MKSWFKQSYIIGPIIIFLALVLMFQAIDQNNVDAMYNREDEIEEVIMRYAIACYAQEGAYPSELTYLEENYGLIIDTDHYDYYYSSFASNILPDIVVKSKGGGE